MCRLFAYKTKNPEKDNELLICSLIEFRKLAKNGFVPVGQPEGHLDGWGIVAYKKNVPCFYNRSDVSMTDDKNFEQVLEIIKNTKPELLIVHIRKTTMGGNNIKNTQPFLSDNISLCHNGTIKGFSKSKTESDSYKFFKTVISKNSNFRKIYNEVSSRYDFTAMNIFFSDGVKLIVARNWNEKYPNAKEMNFSEYYKLFSFTNKNSLFICSEVLEPLKKLETLLLKNKTISIF